MTDNAILAQRGCYCRAGQTTCGPCEVCQAPGHVSHYPGPAAYTGAWCDAHYVEEARTQSAVHAEFAGLDAMGNAD